MASFAIPITLDKQRNIRFGLKAMKTLELKYNKGIIDIIADFQSGASISLICDFIWAGLLHEDPGLTPDNVIDILDESECSLIEVMDAIKKAVDEALQAKNSQAGEANPSKETSFPA